MRCPIDQTDLVMSERQGVEIDYCPTCRGVWLDRGELDKIIDRAAERSGPTASPAGPATGVPTGPAQPFPGSPAPTPARPAYGAPDPRAGRYRFGSAPSAPSPDDYRGGRTHDEYGRPYRRKRKESWLGELFDF